MILLIILPCVALILFVINSISWRRVLVTNITNDLLIENVLNNSFKVEGTIIYCVGDRFISSVSSGIFHKWVIINTFKPSNFAIIPRWSEYHRMIENRKDLIINVYDNKVPTKLSAQGQLIVDIPNTISILELSIEEENYELAAKIRDNFKN